MQEATHSGFLLSYVIGLISVVSVHTECPFSLLDTQKIPHTIKILTPSTKSILQVNLLILPLTQGSYFPWRATAIGRNSSSAKQFLEKRYNPEMELEDAIHTALLTLKEGFEGEMTKDTVEIGIVSEPAQHLLGFEGKKGAIGPRFRKLTPGEVQDYLDNL